ncbi:hypothetical protein AGMMS49944_17400 [Spirochaetia bacterium]|nr:hypothetical protein AGMMS49944_17400 [Spirochaetia bacterium]
MKKFVLVVLFIGLCFSVFGQSESDFYTEINNGTITITGYKGTNKDVVIPEKINGLPVVAIGYGAFIEKHLTSVVIPNSVITIGGGAFRYNQLTSVIIPNSVITIGGYAFGNNQLTSVIIPNSVIFIGGYAFRDNQLTSVIIPNSVIFIGGYAFRDNQLTSVIIPKNIDCFYTSSFDDDVIGFDRYSSEFWLEIKNQSITIVGYRGTNKDVVIPEKINGLPVVAIGGGAFREEHLTSVVIPNSVITIGKYAFSENELSNIVIPTSVKIIEDRAFSGQYLESITIGDMVIGGDAFDYGSVGQ